MLYMLGAKTMVKCAIGVARPVTKSKNGTLLVTADIAYDAVTTVWTAFALMTCAMSLRTAKSTPLTLTSNAATAPPSTMTLTSKGH